jgi:SAM-dependent methyltransferase
LADTGERLIFAGENEIEIEHLARYLFAVGLVEGKGVLDVACGEGYGSALLGVAASDVLGIDRSTEAIERCRRYYASESVRFEVADAAALPLPPGSVDVVVSFETLEHLSDHDSFLDEVKRVLVPDGLLVLSTPDRFAFKALGFESPFHVSELARDELLELLARRFHHVAIGAQRSGAASVIAFPAGDTQRGLSLFDRQARFKIRERTALEEAVYLIALASDAAVPLPPSTLLLDADFLTRLHAAYHVELDRLWEEISQRDAEVAALQATLDELRAASGPMAPPEPTV